MLRAAAWTLGAAGVLLAVAAGIVALVGMPTYEVPTVSLEVEGSPAQVQRGKRLVGMLCRRCHFDAETGRLGGRDLVEVKTRLGVFRAPNITRDATAGIGDWSAGELALLLRTGLHPRREQLVPPPAMPRWPKMADDDLEAIVAFMRSDDPWVQPESREPEPTQYTLIAKVRALVSWSPLPYPRQRIEAPPPEELEALGAYLVDDLLLCTRCHSEEWGEPPPNTRRNTPGYLQGGAATTDVNGVVLRAANLSPHATGLRGWTSEQLGRVLVDGFGPDGKVVRWPMPRYPGLSEHEVEAIHAHLQTVAPVALEVEPSPPYKMIGRKADPGRHQYLVYGCHYCHGEHGKGWADLRGAAKRFEADEALVAFLKDPATEDPSILMPAWDGVIADDELLELAAYVRELGKHGKAD